MDDFVFTNVRRDLLKSVIVSVIAAAAGVGSFQLSPDARVFLALVPVYYIGNKLSWLEISMPEARKGVTKGFFVLVTRYCPSAINTAEANWSRQYQELTAHAMGDPSD